MYSNRGVKIVGYLIKPDTYFVKMALGIYQGCMICMFLIPASIAQVYILPT